MALLPASGRLLLWSVWVTLCLGFVLTPFGGDPSGRYFLPLYLPLFMFAAEALVAYERASGVGPGRYWERCWLLT